MLLKAIQVDYSNDELNLILHELIQFPEQYFDFMCLSFLFRPVQLKQSPSMFIATLCYPGVLYVWDIMMQASGETAQRINMG